MKVNVGLHADTQNQVQVLLVSEYKCCDRQVQGRHFQLRATANGELLLHSLMQLHHSIFK